MKKMRWIILVIIGIITITGCSSEKGSFETISYQDYQKLIENKEDFMVEVMSSDCTHCKSLRPKLQKVINDYKINMKVINLEELSSEDYQAFTNEIGTRATPTIIFYKKGYESSVSTRIVGDVSEEKIIQKMKDNKIIK